MCSPSAGIGSIRGARPGTVIGGNTAESDPTGEPIPLLRQKAQIEHPDRGAGALRPHRQHQILQQREIAGIGGADDDEPRRRIGGVHGISR